MKSAAHPRNEGRLRHRCFWAAFLFIAFLIAMASGFAGCATAPADRESDLPWNVPQSWEGAPMIPGFSSGGM